MARSMVHSVVGGGRRAKWFTTAVALSISGILSLGNLGPAFADTPYIGDSTNTQVDTTLDGNGNKIPPQDSALDPQAQTILNNKIQLGNDYISMLQGTLDSATYQQEYASFLTALGEDPSQHANADRTNTCPDGSVTCIDPNEFDAPGTLSGGPTTLGERNILWGVPQAGISQINSYYCGPATGFAMLTGLSKPRSYYGDTLSQHALAATCSNCPDTRGRFFQTDFWGGTPWNSYGTHHPVAEGLNSWRIGSPYGFYIPTGTHVDFQTFRNNFTEDIDYNWPVAGNADEIAGYPQYHLMGHPGNLTIQHWFAIRGYSNYGNNVHYVDSVYNAPSVTWYRSVTAPNWRMPTSTIAVILDGRGYVW